MPKRGYDDDHEMRDDRGGKSFRDDGGQRRYSGGNEPRGPSDPHRAYFERHKHEEWMLKGYDPKTIERALKKRALEAQQALERFVSHCQGHALEAPPSSSRTGAALRWTPRTGRPRRRPRHSRRRSSGSGWSATSSWPRACSTSSTRRKGSPARRLTPPSPGSPTATTSRPRSPGWTPS